MRMLKMGFVALAFVLVNQITGYTNTTELLRRTYAKPHLKGIESNEARQKSNLKHQKSMNLFLSIDRDHNHFLNEEEMSYALEKKLILSDNIFFRKDADLDGMLSLNEFLIKKEAPIAQKEGSAIKALVVFFDDYGLVSGLAALVILFAGIRYSLNS